MNTPYRDNIRRAYRKARDTELPAGSIAVIGAAGLAIAASEATGLTAVGIVERAEIPAAESVEVRRGSHRVVNSTGADEITSGHIGRRCYLVDAQTVAATDGGGTRSIAGIVDGTDDAGGVWVVFDPTSGAYLDVAPAT
ncbi:hypothetical protein QO259_10395 [Salinicola sp. JS01]|uniref:hypothetical protein n=1 Tax=Salinicola sp. JS01 TaxID=3050071 RepID=UPI00255BE44A|nr:hypothetical protein [Salinicola sp. JS01]WIX31244.1 hypothetical protein QO259_10395 [Salinicola sp. JS01]